MMKKLFVLLIKYMPTIQLVGMLVNNTLYKYDVNLEFDYIGDFLLGNSIANITILYVCSYTFGFCKWHRYIIMANLVNVIIATIETLKLFMINTFVILIERLLIGMSMLQLMHNTMTMFVYTKIGFLILQKNNLMKK